MSDKIVRDYNSELLKILDEFKQKIIDGTTNTDDFLSITDVENLWTKLRGDTSLLYSDILSCLLSSIDEAELIRKKKPNTGQKV